MSATGMTPENYQWLDEALDRKFKFMREDLAERFTAQVDTLGDRLARHKGEYMGVLNEIRTDSAARIKAVEDETKDLKIGMVDHVARPCPDVVRHEDNKHSTVKLVGIVAGISTAAAAMFKLIEFIVGRTIP